MKYIYGKRIKTFKDRATTLIASLAILANSAGVALPVLLTQKVAAAPYVSTTATGFNSLTDWKNDRSQPSGGFSLSDSTLSLHIDGDNPDPKAAGSAFYRTEGRNAALPAGTNSIKATLNVDSAWQNTIGVRAGLWGVTSDNPAYYPILEFSNRNDGNDQIAGSPVIRAWNSSTGTWSNIISNPSYGSSYTFEIVHNPFDSTFEYYVNNSATPVLTATATTNTLSRVIFNSYNSGIAGNDYSVVWSNFEVGVRLPEPEITSLAGILNDNEKYKGLYAEVKTAHVVNAKAVEFILTRADGSTVIKKSRPAPNGSVNGVNSGVAGAPFIFTHGTYDEAGSTSWLPAPATWNKETRPTEVTVLITLADDTTVSKTTLLSISQPEYEALLVTPSTNDINKTKGWAHVNELSKNVGSVELEFVSTRNFDSCFEYRTDGDTSQALATANPNVNVSDHYLAYCLNNRTEVHTIPANEYVEIRMVYGAEKDERFDWTRFDVLEDTTPPAIPTNLSWTPDSGTPLANGSYTNVQKGMLTWQNTDPDVDHYTYHFWTDIPGYYEGQSNAWSTPDGSSYITQSPTGGSIWTDFYDKEGTYYFCVEAVDTAGNRSDCSEVFSLTFDQKAPNAEITSPIDGSVFRGGTLTVTGSVSDTTGMSHYSIYLYDGTVDLNDGEVHGTSRIKLPGTWTAGGETSVAGLLHQPVSRTLDLSVLDEGEYQIRLAVRDLAGNRNATDSVDIVRFTVDKTAPEVSGVVLNGKDVNIARDINCGPTDFNVVGGSIDLSATITDNLSGVKKAVYKIRKVTNGGCTQAAIYQSSTVNMSNSGADEWVTLPGSELDTAGIPEGNYTIQMTLTDNAGNTATKYVDITVDTTAPVVLVDDIDEINTGSNAVVTGSIDDPSISSVEILVNGVLKGTAGVTAGAFSFNIPGLSVGNHNITVRATDNAGNTGEATKSVQVNAVVLGDSTNTPSNPGGGRGGAVSDAGSITTTSTVTRTSTTNSPVTITDNNSDGDTSAEETTEEPEAQVLQATDTANGSDTSGEDETEENNGCGKFLGLCWYLWIPIVIAILGTVYYVSSRRADEK